jgi:hypothetical protein
VNDTDVAAVMHVHSTYSDGTATPLEIAAAASAAGADAVFITDHDSLDARRDGWSGWHYGVLVVIGLEVTTRRGHFLAFGIDEEIDHRGLTEREIAARVRSAGGVGFPAHPFSRGSALSRRIGRPHPWGDLESGDYDGVEVWSFMTDAAERCESLRELAAFVRRPETGYVDPPARNLAAWDELCRTRPVVAIGGLDAHQTGVRLPRARVLSPFPNERIFATLRTHVMLPAALTGDGDHDEARMLAALAAGRCYLAVDAVAAARGFAFVAGDLQMGDEAPYDRQELTVRTPRRADLTLARDGTAIDRADDARELRHASEGHGVYRAEARIDGRVWVMSNPIYLR